MLPCLTRIGSNTITQAHDDPSLAAAANADSCCHIDLMAETVASEGSYGRVAGLPSHTNVDFRRKQC